MTDRPIPRTADGLGIMGHHFEKLAHPRRRRPRAGLLAALIIIALALHAAPKAWQQAQIDARETQE